MTLRDLLSRELANGLVAAALALRAVVREDIGGALALVDNPDEEMAHRVVVLLSIALVAQDGTALPENVFEVLEDDLLVDGVIAAHAEAAITGIVAAAPNISERLRSYLALRLAAAGATGLHIAALLLSAGDTAGAGRAALPALVADVRANAGDIDVIHALAAIIVDWIQARPEFGERLCAALPADVAHVLAPAARSFDPLTAALLDAVR